MQTIKTELTTQSIAPPKTAPEAWNMIAAVESKNNTV